jgi:hypothetical protein
VEEKGGKKALGKRENSSLAGKAGYAYSEEKRSGTCK